MKRPAQPRLIATLLLMAPALALPACGDSGGTGTGGTGDTGATGDTGGEGPAWHQVLSELPGTLYSVSGTSASNVWTVGADYGDGMGPSVLHYDGASWSRVDPGLTEGDFWWVHVFDAASMVFSGSHGRVVRYEDGAFTEMETPGSGEANEKVFGVWGSSPDDMWAVGGQFGTFGSGFVWHYTGGAWENMTLPELDDPPDNFLKPWGTGPDDVWIVGNFGAMLHWDGTELSAVDPGTDDSLFTVHGLADGSLVTAVGGASSGTLVTLDAGTWSETGPEENVSGLFGVHHSADVGYAVGLYGAVVRYEDGAWADVATDLGGDSLHGVWVDPSGGVYSVGGDLLSGNQSDGVLIYFGADAPPSDIE